MTWNKHKKQLEAALAATLRLLVLIRESLSRQPGGEKTPLFTAVAAHANLCGVLLPDELRMSQAEIDRLRVQLDVPPAAHPPGIEAIKTGLVKSGIQVLTPDGRGGLKV